MPASSEATLHVRAARTWSTEHLTTQDDTNDLRSPAKSPQLGGALVAHHLIGVEKLQCGPDVRRDSASSDVRGEVRPCRRRRPGRMPPRRRRVSIEMILTKNLL